MKEAHEIVKSVQTAYKKVVTGMARITAKSEEWFYSHGREPKTQNPLQSGNKSPVTDYMTYCRQYDAAERGAGRCLSNRVHSTLDAEFSEGDLIHTDQCTLHVDVIEETSDVEKWLAQFQIDEATRKDLKAFEDECEQAMEAIIAARGRARVRIREIEMQRRVAS